MSRTDRQMPMGDRIVAGLAATTVVLLLAGFAFVVGSSQRDARRSLGERYAARAALTASFTREYVDDLASREAVQAGRLLAAETVDEATFDQVIHAFDFDAAVLLDAEGRLLQIAPSKPELIGTDLASKYEHLRAAVNGEVGVSDVVPSAAEGVPVSAIAVPFDTPFGRRVLSGAFSPATTPLSGYFGSVTAVPGSNAFLIDRYGDVLASGHDDPELAARLDSLHDGLQEVDAEDDAVTIAVAPVDGTPWRVAMTAPSASLYAPLGKTQWAPWALWVALALFGVVGLVLFIRLSRARTFAAASARTDMLTGLPNRRAMEESLERAVADAVRHDRSLAVLMIDLDHFKMINDVLGHHGGDDVLRGAAHVLRESIRGGDVAARWGGEEFLVLLPATELHGALTVAERIRAAVGSIAVDVNVTTSVGLALLDGDDVDELLRRADGALYRAKEAGRDCIVTAATSAHPGVPRSEMSDVGTPESV